MEKKCVSFFSIDLATGSVLWRDRTVEEPYWVGIEALVEGVLLLHGYQTPDMPEHKGLHALDARTGETLWRNDDLKFFLAAGSRVYAVRETFDSRIYHSLGLRDGKDAGEVPPEEMMRVRREAARTEVPGDPEIRFPRILSHQAEDPQTLGRIRNLTPSGSPDTVRLVEYLETGDFTAVAYYQAKGAQGGASGMEQHLVVAHAGQQGGVVYRERMASQAALPLPEQFFLFRSTLLFVKESNTLLSLDLKRHG